MTQAKMPLPKWERRACNNVDPEDFFTDDGATEVPALAARWCQGCEIQTECLDWAIKHKEKGVWGNTTEAQRKKLMRGIARVHCPGCAAIDILDIDGTEICLACGLSWKI